MQRLFCLGGFRVGRRRELGRNPRQLLSWQVRLAFRLLSGSHGDDCELLSWPVLRLTGRDARQHRSTWIEADRPDWFPRILGYEPLAHGSQPQSFPWGTTSEAPRNPPTRRFTPWRRCASYRLGFSRTRCLSLKFEMFLSVSPGLREPPSCNGAILLNIAGCEYQGDGLFSRRLSCS